MANATTTPLTAETLRYGAEQLAAADPDLGHLYERLGTPPLWAREPGFATLIRIILEQQVSLKAARTLYRRVHTHLGEMSPQAVLIAGEAGLKALGLTRQKARYCYQLAQRIYTGQLRLDRLEMLNDPEGRQTLLAIPGLGPWSVDIYYLMALRRPDIWPRGDLALATALQDVKKLEAPATHHQQQRFARAWAPWRAIAARLLWMHYLELRGGGPYVP
ncbi:DNA-3-methyladenine glycosylase family protein [Marinobacter sp. X15-166B]|uniref:DNA-3-methyladenine glycosylase family protein n=1 Tax=Marinobacter sp. X15-166B TaxID=1897620 RepID=UPI00085CB7CD|nr:DNA-3-methyladenine glycosylase [Marinobacter sp. X15-166B]OEY65399.1 3-methyladenine DNA glycosylase [Marinobacter sp. X15-166B]